MDLTTNEIVAISTCALVFVSAAAIFWSLRGVRADLWLRTFAEYTRRYNEIMHDLPSESRRSGDSFSLDTLDKSDRSRAENAIRAYFNLASEEHFLHHRRHIDDETWGIWCDGIRSVLRTTWIRNLWATMDDEYYGYEPFQMFMRRIVAEIEAERQSADNST